MDSVSQNKYFHTPKNSNSIDKLRLKAGSLYIVFKPKCHDTYGKILIDVYGKTLFGPFA